MFCKGEWVSTLEAIPWLRRVTADKPCDGIKWGKVALKHLYSMSGRPAEGIPDRARCKRRAKWHFTALRGSRSKTGDYCFSHVWVQILDADREQERYEKWADERWAEQQK